MLFVYALLIPHCLDWYILWYILVSVNISALFFFIFVFAMLVLVVQYIESISQYSQSRLLENILILYVSVGSPAILQCGLSLYLLST